MIRSDRSARDTRRSDATPLTGARRAIDPSPPPLGDQLKRHRLTAGLSQEELAARSGVSARSIGNMERGVRHRPRRDTLRLLAEALELSAPDRDRFEAAARRWAAADPAPPSVGQLPVPPTPLVGRAEEVDAVRRRLLGDGAALLTLTGPAGVGKTRLALAVGAALDAALADGGRWVDLAPLADPAEVPAAVARAVGVGDVDDRRLHGVLTARLRERRLLLVLDNVEHLPGAAPFVDGLVAACPGLKVLATGRAPLGLRREQVLPVPPLPLPPRAAGPLPPETLARVPAVALFLQRARSVRPDFALTPENAAAVAALCVRLDGLPLAIELAAARVALLSPAAMLARLDRRLALPPWDAPDLPARHRTLAAAIGWSYDLLDPAERALFRRLGTFVGGFTLAAAEAVGGGGGAEGAEGTETTRQSAPPSSSSAPGSAATPLAPSAPLPVSTLDLLASLADRSLVRVDPSEEDEGGDAEAGARFGLLETIREHARERLELGGEAEEARRRHAAYYLALAERAEPELVGAAQPAWLDRLEREHDNLRAALRWATDRGEAETASRLGGALWRFWLVRGHLGEGRARLDAALALPGETPPAVRARACLGAGRLAREQGDLERAEARLDEALGLLRTLGDAAGEALALGQLGVIAYDRGDFPRSAARHEESLRLRRELGDTTGVAGTLTNLGEVARHRGDHARSVALHEESLALFRSLGDAWGTSLVLGNLGLGRHNLGDHARGAALLAESLSMKRALGDRVGTAESLDGMGMVALARGDAGEAARLLGAADALREAVAAPIPPVDRAPLDRALATTRAALGEEAFAAAWAAGRAEPLDRVVADAIRAADPTAIADGATDGRAAREEETEPTG